MMETTLPKAVLTVPIPSVLGAFSDEIQARINTGKTCPLFSGKKIRTTPEFSYYRFEIPEGLHLQGITEISCTFGTDPPVTCSAHVVDQVCQYLTLAFETDLGGIISAVTISWNPAALPERAKAVLERKQDENTVSLGPSASIPVSSAGPRVTIPGRSEQYQDALNTIESQPLTLLWGPQASGKSSLCSMAALQAIADGKRVLYVNPVPGQLDRWMRRILRYEGRTTLGLSGTMMRVGMPTHEFADELLPWASSRILTEKHLPHAGKGAALAAHIAGKIRNAMGEDHRDRLNDLRARVEEKNRQIAELDAGIKELHVQLETIQNASMLERVKRGFSKEAMLEAQKRYQDKLSIQKRLQNIQSALSTEILKQELRAPLNDRELRAYREATQTVVEAGGVDELQQALTEERTAAFHALLRDRKLVAATLADALLFPADITFDLVIVDDANAISLGYLAALAGFATERFLLSGDPLEIGPAAAAYTEPAIRWMHREIFEYAAGVTTLYQFFDWARQEPQGSIFLTTQHTTAPKLARFSATTLFNDNFQIEERLGGKGKIYFIDTSDLHSQARQYIGRKKILPCNELQAKKTVEAVKHALMEPGRTAGDVGVVVPFPGPTLHLKRELRLNGIENVDVGLPQEFTHIPKRAIVFDTTVAGIDYTTRALDDRKIGTHAILRMFQTIFSSTKEDLYVLADMSHFRSIYKHRITLDILNALQQAAQLPPMMPQAVKKFDDLTLEERGMLFDISEENLRSRTARAGASHQAAVDAETEIRMRLAAKQADAAAKSAPSARNYPHETMLQVFRVLGKLADVNLVSLFIGGPLLFRRTPSAEEALAKLPGSASQSEKDFRDIMEAWNVVIYEMSGGNKSDLSFFSRQAPETRIRWDINNLKTYYSSDVEAAIEEGKHQVAVAVAKIFQEVLGKPQPTSSGDWSMAYLSFLSKLELYLDWISQQIKGENQ